MGQDDGRIGERKGRKRREGWRLVGHDGEIWVDNKLTEERG